MKSLSSSGIFLLCFLVDESGGGDDGDGGDSDGDGMVVMRVGWWW